MRPIFSIVSSIIFASLFLGGAAHGADSPLLLRNPSLSRDKIAFLYANGQWEVEGHGIAPDVEVEEFPKDVVAGHDAQLERAVAIVMQQLKEHPVQEPPIPPYPNYYPHDSVGKS